MQIFFENKIIVGIPKQTTHYLVGSNLLENLDKIMKKENTDYSSYLILADEKAFSLFGEKILTSFKKLGNPVVVSTILSNEQNKNLNKVTEIVRPHFQHGFDRHACVIAIGGGVVTDLGGFIASILLRGIGSIYIPTTLLGQVDASIGGKTGVNLDSGNIIYKNMIGTFKQPALVISDVETLATLPEREWISGLGEIVKYWVGWGGPSIDQISNIKYQKSGALLARIINHCQEIKLRIVEADPFETKGIRQKLNLGHTIGHAIEGVSRGKLAHGEAVSIGLATSARISLAMNLLGKHNFEKIIEGITSLGLPVQTTGIDPLSVLKALKFDKKGGTFVLIRNIGSLETDVKVDSVLVEKVLKEILL